MSLEAAPGFYTDPSGQRRWWDGKQWGLLESEAFPSQAEPIQHETNPFSPTAIPSFSPSSVYVPTDEQPPTPSAKRSPKHMSIFIIGTMILVAAIASLLLGVQRWEKIIEPEHPETFTRTVLDTGIYHVEEEERTVCWEGQDWYSCIDAMIFSYNSACADRKLDEYSFDLCDEYDAEIRRMEEQNAPPDWEVVQPGSWGRLTYREKQEVKYISNNDYRPAVTEEAICLFGVFLECPDEESEEKPARGDRASSQNPSSMY